LSKSASCPGGFEGEDSNNQTYHTHTHTLSLLAPSNIPTQSTYHQCDRLVNRSLIQCLLMRMLHLPEFIRSMLITFGQSDLRDSKVLGGFGCANKCLAKTQTSTTRVRVHILPLPGRAMTSGACECTASVLLSKQAEFSYHHYTPGPRRPTNPLGGNSGTIRNMLDFQQLEFERAT